MQPHHSPLMARLAQSHNGVMPLLLDVVRVTWAWLIAYAARQFLDAAHMLRLRKVQGSMVSTSHAAAVRMPFSVLSALRTFDGSRDHRATI